MANMDILKVCNLRKIYHTSSKEILAVDNFSFNLKKGEFVAIVGPSGCGKSTILSILCSLDKKSSGDIYCKDGLKFGYMMQKDNLFEWKTVLENCLLGLEIENKVDDDSIKYVKDLLNCYGLGDFMNDFPSSLSGGMRQRVSLIRTLAVNPDVLLLDEPYSALDYQASLNVSNDVYEIIKKEKKSAIMVTHDIAMAVSMADRVVVLSARPSKVKKVYEINYEKRGTPTSNRKRKEFSRYYDLVWKDIDYHV